MSITLLTFNTVVFTLGKQIFDQEKKFAPGTVVTVIVRRMWDKKPEPRTMAYLPTTGFPSPCHTGSAPAA